MKVVLTNDGSRTLFSETAGECYHSESGAISEAKVVFLQNSGVLKRLSQGLPTRVLEIGLGTGLNFLLTADQALKLKTRLEYIGIDLVQLNPSQIVELGYEVFLRDSSILARWLTYNERPCNEQPQTMPQGMELFPGVNFQSIPAEAENAVDNHSAIVTESFDCVYHDAFSPDASPELWTNDFLGKLYRVLKPGGNLTTYCVKSTIQKRLKSVGFQVHCLPGPEGGKRQVLLATKY